MNRLIKSTPALALILMLVGVSLSKSAQAQPMGEVTMQTFYDELQPYGEWVDDPDYGYVWIPEVDDPGFRPYYTDGHWAMTEYGNMWVSDYDWGWAPFHYGRWAYTDYYGWVWIPDTEWGPAWVSWRTGGDYYGWAPLGPRVSIDIAIGGYICPDFWWTFVPRRHFFSIGFSRYYVPFSRNALIIRNTTFITNIYYGNNYRCIAGPWARDIGHYYRGRINVYNVHAAGRPGRSIVYRNNINIYRPSVRQHGNYRPSRYVNRDTYRGDRHGYTQRNYRGQQGRGQQNGRGNGQANRPERRYNQGNPGNGRNRNEGISRNDQRNRNNIFDRPNNGNGNRPDVRGNRNQGNGNQGRQNRGGDVRGNGNQGRQYNGSDARGNRPGNYGNTGRQDRRIESRQQQRGNDRGISSGPGGDYGRRNAGQSQNRGNSGNSGNRGRSYDSSPRNNNRGGSYGQGNRAGSSQREMGRSQPQRNAQPQRQAAPRSNAGQGRSGGQQQSRSSSRRDRNHQ